MALSNFTRNYGIVTSFPNTDFRVFTHNSGSAQSDKQLLVVVTMANTRNFGNATYNGVLMTQVLSKNFGGLSQKQAVFTLANPADGNNQFRIDFNGSQFNGVSIACYTFIGCAGVGDTGINGGSSTPNSKSLTCSNNSMIMLCGISNNGFQNFVIDGVSKPALYQHNVNKQTAGALSNNVSAGSITCTSVVNSGNVTNVRVEMLEAAAPPSGNSGNFLMMFN
jgi:hypothetical protein